jgi:hypothetical protein
MRQEDFNEACYKLKEDIMFVNQNFACDALGRQIKLGDLIGKVQYDDIYSYVVLAESDLCFYLGMYTVLQDFTSGNITSVKNLKDLASTRLHKKKSRRSIILEPESIGEMIRETSLHLQEKILKFYEELEDGD